MANALAFFSSPLAGGGGCVFEFSPPIGTAPQNLVLNAVTSDVIVNVAGSPYGWAMCGMTASTGADVWIDILHSSSAGASYTSIFSGSVPDMPAGSIALQQGAGFKTQTWQVGDRLRGEVLQIGSGNPGQSFTLQVYWR